MHILSTSERAALDEVSAALGVDPRWLDVLINFESGWNTRATNAISGARGLIQFLPSTAASLGYGDADLLVETYPDIESQLRGPVLKYLSQFKPFTSDYDLFMSVFYPKARTQPPSAQFPDSVQRANPGLHTPQDYVDLVYKHAGIERAAVVGGSVVVALLLAGSFIYYLRRGLRRGAKKGYYDH
jgi:hypothetical protein